MVQPGILGFERFLEYLLPAFDVSTRLVTGSEHLVGPKIIGRKLEIFRGVGVSRNSAFRNKSNVCRAHRYAALRGARNDEAGLRRQHIAETIFTNVTCQVGVQISSASPMIVSSRCHTPQFSFDKLVATAVIRHAQQLFFGHVRCGDAHRHSLSLLIGGGSAGEI